MAKHILCYSLGNIAPKKRLKFHQELYGYTDRSNHGRYEYRRRGILTDLQYQKPFDSVLIVPTEATEQIAQHLRKYRAQYINYRILK